ncbi:MAG: RNase J family beta-CASP ribonuclease [Candidatus Nanoarchaeia archaeon]|jgi:ribonuclease J|nr:RNase J family beta-CASP ribonuclease [Candidatus Nanoarchaeia archaeon]MDD3994139.1 RNase J family beta-CASP ribonuclease [Candidatus Nanoarchaeia archaeon]MDD4563803.1 RNase J family beta-CASP ribonuclease [Candidatus Nanoarchaeia archaeon]
MVKVHTVGGFSEVGKNMVVVELEDDAFIFDEGFFLPSIVSMQEKEKVMTEKILVKNGAIPDDSVISNIRNKVRAQFIGHAHLDHVGAIPFMSDKYNAPIYGTPFTINVLKSLLDDNKLILKNKVYSINPNTSFYVQGKNKKYKIDFINITHSTPQTVMIAIHTEKGVILYANDFKMDDTPVLGLKPNYKVLREIADEGVLCFIVDSLYSGTERKTPSEKIARSLLEEVLLTIQNQKNGMVVTTFSSHIARLKSIVEFSKKIDREIVLLGRSMDKYSKAAINSKIAPFLQDIKISKYRKQVEKTLNKVNKNRDKYMVVCTGHQGEPGSILERFSRHDLPFRINQGDNIIFSSSVIPTPINQEQFKKMEARLKKNKPRIFRDVHVSGHAGREDLRDILNIVRPKHVIPSHGGFDKTGPMISLLKEMGYKEGKNAHLMENGGVLRL